MARVVQASFELNSAGSGGDMTIASGSPTIVTTAPRSGTYHARIVSLTSATVKGWRSNVTAAAVTNAVLFPRIYLRVITLPGASGSSVMSLTNRSGFTTPQLYARLLSTGAIELLDEDGSIGTSSTLLSADGSYHRIEMKLDQSGAGGSHVCELKIDGVVEVTASNRDIAASGASFNIGGNLLSEANTTGEWYIDDCACNDNSGTAENSYPGPGKIAMMFVTGDGDTTNRGVQGTDYETQPTPSGSASQMVDDSPTPDDATTYLQLLTTSAGPTDPPVLLFSVEAASGKGISSGDTIKVVAVRGRQGSPGDATGRNAVILMKSGATYSESAVLSYSGITWNWDDGSAGYNNWSRRVNYVDPNTSALWTLAALEALQIGARASNDVTPPPNFTMFALEVEYEPVSAAVISPPAGAAALTGTVMDVSQRASNQILIRPS